MTGTNTTINVVRDVKEVTIADITTNTIDVGDVEVFRRNDGNGSTQFGIVVHEVVENLEIQENGRKVGDAHEIALQVEADVTGNTRIDERIVENQDQFIAVDTFRNEDGGITEQRTTVNRDTGRFQTYQRTRGK